METAGIVGQSETSKNPTGQMTCATFGRIVQTRAIWSGRPRWIEKLIFAPAESKEILCVLKKVPMHDDQVLQVSLPCFM